MLQKGLRQQEILSVCNQILISPRSLERKNKNKKKQPDLAPLTSNILLPFPIDNPQIVRASCIASLLWYESNYSLNVDVVRHSRLLNTSIFVVKMSSSVFYKFKSQKEPTRVEFDGTGISVFELKREIIVKSGLGDGSDFDLAIFDEDGKDGRFHFKRLHRQPRANI